MIYIPVEKSSAGVAKVIYTSKDGKTWKTFNALDWPRRRDVPLAHLVTHVPGRYESRQRRDEVIWLLQQQIQGAPEKS